MDIDFHVLAMWCHTYEPHLLGKKELEHNQQEGEVHLPYEEGLQWGDGVLENNMKISLA